MLYDLKKPEYNHGKCYCESHCKVKNKSHKAIELWVKYCHHKIYIYHFIYIMYIMCICNRNFQIIAQRRHTFNYYAYSQNFLILIEQSLEE